MALYFLAINPDVQEKAIEEADKVTSALGDRELSGDNIADLKYIEGVFSEAGRLAPVFPVTTRLCTKPWVLPGRDGAEPVVIPEGMRVIIPVLGLHMDPEHYPDPEKFDPGRYSNERKHNIKTGSYLTFGTGPRACMGTKIARLEGKVLLYQVLKNFRVEPVPGKTQVPLKWSPNHFNRLDGGVFLNFVPRH